jgi:hypothetical protein
MDVALVPAYHTMIPLVYGGLAAPELRESCYACGCTIPCGRYFGLWGLLPELRVSHALGPVHSRGLREEEEQYAGTVRDYYYS